MISFVADEEPGTFSCVAVCAEALNAKAVTKNAASKKVNCLFIMFWFKRFVQRY